MGSVTGLMENVSIFDRRTKDDIEIENQRLRDLLHDKVEQISRYSQTNDRLAYDAARWNFAKQQYCTKLGYDTPDQLQKKVDDDMRANNAMIDGFTKKAKKQ